MEHDHLKAKLEASEEKYNMLKKNTQIRAPFAGIVTEILVKEGENFMLMLLRLILLFSFIWHNQIDAA